jgi:hypothetical protein
MPGMNMMNNPHPDDQEAAMARADLYKMANYSFKLFKMIKDGDQLEGWVQAKITKSADYIASVYHYLEYEMKFSEYGNKIENSDMYTEDVRKQFQRKLTEAKVKLDKLKKKNEKDLDEAFDDKAKVGDTKKTRTGELTKTDKGVVHKNTSYKDDGEADEKSGKGKSHAKGQSAADKKNRAPALKQSPKSAKTWGMKDSEKFDNRDKVKEGMAPMNPDGATAPPPKGKDGQYPMVTSGPHKGKRWSPNTPGPTNPAVKEGTKKGDGNLANNAKPYDKVTKGDVIAGRLGKDEKGGKVKEAADKCNHSAKGKSCPVHGMKECSSMYEGDKFDPLKHVKNPTKGEKTAAKDVKRGSYGDRAAMLKSAEKDGRLKG